MLRNWKAIKNKPFASKQLFLKSPCVYCIFKQIHLLGAEAGEEMRPGGTTEHESGVPSGTQP